MAEIDWSATQRNPMGGKRGKYASGKELFQKTREEQLAREEEAKRYQQMEPLLRKCLFDYMVGRKQIQVVRTFSYLTEEFQKSDSPADMGRFKEVSKPIPVGTKLTFSHINKTLKQWIFKSEDGNEIEIYDAPVVLMGGVRGAPIPTRNPGWYGLLLNTNIFEEVSKALGYGNQSGEEA